MPQTAKNRWPQFALVFVKSPVIFEYIGEE
jgi:hypothetical protein